MISKVNDRDRSGLVIIRIYDPEAPSALSVRLNAVYEIWLGNAAVDRSDLLPVNVDYRHARVAHDRPLMTSRRPDSLMRTTH